jgi:hypothetical protein
MSEVLEVRTHQLQIQFLSGYSLLVITIDYIPRLLFNISKLINS